MPGGHRTNITTGFTVYAATKVGEASAPYRWRGGGHWRRGRAASDVLHLARILPGLGSVCGAPQMGATAKSWAPTC